MVGMNLNPINVLATAESSVSSGVDNSPITASNIKLLSMDAIKSRLDQMTLREIKDLRFQLQQSEDDKLYLGAVDSALYLKGINFALPGELGPDDSTLSSFSNVDEINNTVLINVSTRLAKTTLDNALKLWQATAGNLAARQLLIQAAKTIGVSFEQLYDPANPDKSTTGTIKQIGEAAEQGIGKAAKPFQWLMDVLTRLETVTYAEVGGGLGTDTTYSASGYMRITDKYSGNGFEWGLGCTSDNPCSKDNKPLTLQLLLRLPGGRVELYGGLRHSAANGGVRYYFGENPLYNPTQKPDGTPRLPETEPIGATGFNFHPEYDPYNRSTEKRGKTDERAHQYRWNVGTEIFRTHSTEVWGGALYGSGWAFGFNGVGVNPTLKVSGSLDGDVTVWGLVSFSIYGSGPVGAALKVYR